MTDRGWRREFDDPILLPDGRTLSTLADAALFIAELPKREHDTSAWQAAIEALMLVAESGGPTRFARIGKPSHAGYQSAQEACEGVQDRQMIQELPRGPDVG
ncbi:hypothetical protein [Bradyrhizobium sp. DASA03007]|uniref:hypothetical protein n=1 Tax=unclassified Bradyrhizobium TaxID=2631580 RepID=UPI003F6ED9EA